MRKAEVGGFVVLTFEFRKNDDEGVWEGHCRELGTATFGETLEEVQEELSEFVSLKLDTLEEVGERERFFKKHGIRFFRTKPPKTVDVPVSENVIIQRRDIPVASYATA